MKNPKMTLKNGMGATIVLVTALLLLASGGSRAAAEREDGAGSIPRSEPALLRIPVSGRAVHYLSTAVIHSKTSSADGRMIQRSTEVIRLSGDLNGYVLYHPTSAIDTVSGTLVNTGVQVFSGTVAGSEPLLLRDDSFRFEVDLTTGETTGEVHLSRTADDPQGTGSYECDLSVTGTGVTSDGDNLADYRGECTVRGGMK